MDSRAEDDALTLRVEPRSGLFESISNKETGLSLSLSETVVIGVLLLRESRIPVMCPTIRSSVTVPLPLNSSTCDDISILLIQFVVCMAL